MRTTSTPDDGPVNRGDTGSCRETERQRTRWETSDLAWEEAKEQAGAVEAKVLAALAEEPSTCDALQVRLGMIHQTCSPAVNALMRRRLIHRSGSAKTRSGRKAAVWSVGPPSKEDSNGMTTAPHWIIAAHMVRGGDTLSTASTFVDCLKDSMRLEDGKELTIEELRDEEARAIAESFFVVLMSSLNLMGAGLCAGKFAHRKEIEVRLVGFPVRRSVKCGVDVPEERDAESDARLSRQAVADREEVERWVKKQCHERPSVPE